MILKSFIVCLQIVDESGPFGDFEREVAAALPNWEQKYALFTVDAYDFVNNKKFAFRFADFLHINMLSTRFSARLFVPTAAESVALTPPPIALYATGERVVDVERSLCLLTLPSVTGVVCVSKEERYVAHNKLGKDWLKRIRATIVDHLCAQIEELNTAQYTTIMRAFKPQFCVSSILLFCLLYIELFQAAFVAQAESGRRWLMQRALRFSSSASFDATTLVDYLSRVPKRAPTGGARCPSYAHNSILYVCAASYDAAAANPLVERAKSLGVELLILLDDVDTQLVARAPAFQDCPFVAPDERVLDAIVAWNRDEPATEKSDLTDER